MMIEDLSHAAYELWWREHGGTSKGYSAATHMENKMSAASRIRLPEGTTVEGAYDYFRARFSPLFAAEAYRRWLAARAKSA